MVVIKNVKIYKENELIDVVVIIEGNLIKEVCLIIFEKYLDELIFDGNG